MNLPYFAVISRYFIRSVRFSEIPFAPYGVIHPMARCVIRLSNPHFFYRYINDTYLLRGKKAKALRPGHKANPMIFSMLTMWFSLEISPHTVLSLFLTHTPSRVTVWYYTKAYPSRERTDRAKEFLQKT